MSKIPRPTAIHVLEDQEIEIHLFGDYVGVCFSLTPVKKTKTIKGDDGLTYKATYKEQQRGAPYIDLVNIRELNGEFWNDDDNIADFGIVVESARQLSKELLDAALYLENLETK